MSDESGKSYNSSREVSDREITDGYLIGGVTRDIGHFILQDHTLCGIQIRSFLDWYLSCKFTRMCSRCEAAARKLAGKGGE